MFRASLFGGLVVAFLIDVALLARATSAAPRPQFQDIVRDVLPGVVHIRSTERPMRSPAVPDPYQYFFRQAIAPGVQTFPLASGFLVGPRAHVITSFQAIDGAQSLEVVVQRRAWKARLLGGDRVHDLAVLQIEGTQKLPTLEFGDSSRVLAADPVLIIGMPLGFEPLLVPSTVAAKGQVLGAGPYNRRFILNTPGHPGTAGGPVFDSRGRVVGMASFSTDGPAHLGFAVPSQLLQPSIREIIQHGRVQRAWIGLVARSLVSVDSIAEVYDPSIRSGLLVENLIVDGPSAQAGIQVGDLLLTAGDLQLHELTQLQDQLARMRTGDRLTFKIFRRKQGFVTITVKLGDLPSAEDLPPTQDLL